MFTLRDKIVVNHHTTVLNKSTVFVTFKIAFLKCLHIKFEVSYVYKTKLEVGPYILLAAFQRGHSQTVDYAIMC